MIGDVGQVGRTIGHIGSRPAQGVGVVGPFPAPQGFRWTSVNLDAEPVAFNDQPVVMLERIAA